MRVALIIAFERQVEDFGLLARKANAVQRPKDSFDRQNELLKVP